MNLRYDNYSNYNIEKEIEKINSANTIYIKLEPRNKKCLFLLGIIFSAGKRIVITNEKYLDFGETSKSFTMMAYVWSKLMDNNFPNSDFSNVLTEMDKRIENIKRLGVNVKPIINDVVVNKIFLICPVRNASDNTKKWIEKFVLEQQLEGTVVHAPHLHTEQTDMFGGYTICLQNELALASSKEVNIYYNQNSMGSVFDLGAAYYLEKPLTVLNASEIVYQDNDFMDNIIKSWPFSRNTLESKKCKILQK